MKIAAQLLTALLAMQVALAGAATIDTNKSAVTATFKQLGVEVTARFNRVSGAIDFDPAHPSDGKARVSVALESFDLGEPEYNREVQKKEWFDSAQFPRANFVSNSIKSAGAGKLLAQGRLTIKGKALDVSVPVAFKRAGNMQVFEGALPIRRLYFDIGDGEWRDTDTLADEVIIKFKVVTSD